MANAYLSTANSYAIWRWEGEVNSRVQDPWEGEADSRVQDPSVSRILDLLDPIRTSRCVFCGKEKIRLSAGRVSCDACSHRCPDPDCRGAPHGIKEPDAESCRHCANFVRSLDAPCHGCQETCDLAECDRGRESDRSFGPLGCFGPTRERDGYFVYQLETGYIGMTYNPSRRQFDHDRSEKLWRYIDSRSDIRNPGAYFRKIFYDDIEECWEKHYDAHWRRVRNSDKNAVDERRISWLSPALNTRHEAYRCEWALKQYEREADKLFPDTYDKVVSQSSFPIIVFQSAGMDYNAVTGRISFDLSWGLPGRLGPSQVVPVSRYELQRYDADVAEYIAISSDCEPSFLGQLGPDSAGDWRVRAVNLDDIPGPWTCFPVSHQDIAMGVQKLVGISDVTAALVDSWNGEVLVSWSVANPLPGIRYEVERCKSDGACDVIDVGNAVHFHDAFVVQEVTICQYRVRAVLDGVGGAWQSGGKLSSCVVGGIYPGPVDGLSSNCRSDGSIDLQWNAPNWLGYDTVQGYGVEIIRAGAMAEYACVRNVAEWYDADSKADHLSDVFYRVRPWNAIGCGPWSETVCVDADMRSQAIRSALPSVLQLQVTDADVNCVSFQWTLRWPPGVGDGLSYDLETSTDDEAIVRSSYGRSVAVPVDWSSVKSLIGRLRIVRRGVAGCWSVPIAVCSAKDYESALHLTWPKGVDIGFVVVAWESSPPSVVAVWARRDSEFFTRMPVLEVPLLGRVTDSNKGGLEVFLGGIHCFVPKSRVRGNAGRLDTRVGDFIGLSVLSVNECKLKRYHRELVCADIPPTSSNQQSAGISRDRRAEAGVVAAIPRVTLGSVVAHRTLGRSGKVVRMGDKSAMVEFADAPELGTKLPVACLVCDLTPTETDASVAPISTYCCVSGMLNITDFP